MGTFTLGDQELLLLRHVAETGPRSVAEVAASFGAQQGWARSTVLTVMDRLRKKGFLVRKTVDGIFRYQSKSGAEALMREVVGTFIDTTLAGSLSPFVAYLAGHPQVSKAELAQLTQIAARLDGKGAK